MRIVLSVCTFISTKRQLAWIEGETNSTLIKVVNLTSGEISVLVENLMEEPLDIDIDTVTGALYWITVNGKLQSFSTSIETIYECDGLMPTSLAIFEVYAYIVIQRSIIRINVLKPQGRKTLILQTIKHAMKNMACMYTEGVWVNHSLITNAHLRTSKIRSYFKCVTSRYISSLKYDLVCNWVLLHRWTSLKSRHDSPHLFVSKV